MLICVLGVSGAGKNTLIERLTKKWDVEMMPTATTREMRPHEFQTRPYVFLSKKEFEKKKKRGEFFETCEVHKGTMMGTLKSILQDSFAKNKILVKDIDVYGYLALKKAGVDVVSVFVKTSNLDILRDRLRKRGEPEEKIDLRLSRADFELAFEQECDYSVLNDDLETAVADFEKIVLKEAAKRNKKIERNTRKDFYVVYNSTAGKGKAQPLSREIAGRLLEFGDVELVCSKSEKYIREYFAGVLPKSGADAVVVVVGGDGTLGTTIDAVLKSRVKASIATFPCGTANDFSRSLKASKKIDRLVELLRKNEPLATDVAKINGKTYCVHAVGAGSFGHGSMEFSSTSKKRFGLLAYWIKCFFKAFRMKAQRMEVVIDGQKFEDEFLFFYFSNGNVAGGFHSFAPTAEIDDGCFDFVGIRKCNIFVFAWVFVRLLFGRHEKSRWVTMKKASKAHIECIGQPNANFAKLDVDGNKGPDLPLDLEVEKRKVLVFTEKNLDKK